MLCHDIFPFMSGIRIEVLSQTNMKNEHAPAVESASCQTSSVWKKLTFVRQQKNEFKRTPGKWQWLHTGSNTATDILWRVEETKWRATLNVYVTNIESKRLFLRSQLAARSSVLITTNKQENSARHHTAHQSPQTRHQHLAVRGELHMYLRRISCSSGILKRFAQAIIVDISHIFPCFKVQFYTCFM